MTDAEIVRSYNEAANKNKQIGILSELTLKPVNEIADILKANGMQLPEKHEKEEPAKNQYAKYSWTNEREAKLLALREQGLTWEQIAEEIGGTKKSVSMHYYTMQKPKHTPRTENITDRVTEPIKDTPCPVTETPQKASAFGFDNIVSVLLNGKFDSVTFENAEVCVTVRRKE